MILFIDDEPEMILSYIAQVSSLGLKTRVLTSVKAVSDFLSQSPPPPQCIVLDVMFPSDPDLPGFLTAYGLKTGLLLFASLRSHFPEVPIIILTRSTADEVKRFFRGQERCALYDKTAVSAAMLAKVVADLARDRGGVLLEELRSCLPGHAHANQFEAVCIAILDYLFVPPLSRILSQSHRLDGHEIRDAVLPNNSTDYFWSSLRLELDAKHIVAEFKNHRRPVAKEEVIQLRTYLSRKSIVLPRRSPSCP